MPISTGIMLHGIAAIAREQGEDLASAAARAECVSIFALGARAANDDAAETGYYGLPHRLRRGSRRSTVPRA